MWWVGPVMENAPTADMEVGDAKALRFGSCRPVPVLFDALFLERLELDRQS